MKCFICGKEHSTYYRVGEEWKKQCTAPYEKDGATFCQECHENVWKMKEDLGGFWVGHAEGCKNKGKPPFYWETQLDKEEFVCKRCNQTVKYPTVWGWAKEQLCSNCRPGYKGDL